MASQYLSPTYSAHELRVPENQMLASIELIREILVALSTQLISNADKVTSADTQGTFFKTTIYINSSTLNSISKINKCDTIRGVYMNI